VPVSTGRLTHKVIQTYQVFGVSDFHKTCHNVFPEKNIAFFVDALKEAKRVYIQISLFDYLASLDVCPTLCLAFFFLIKLSTGIEPILPFYLPRPLNS